MLKKVLFIALLLVIGTVAGFGSWYFLKTNSPEESTSGHREQPIEKPEPTLAEIRTEKLTCIAALPLETRIGQKIMAGGYASQIELAAKDFAAASIGGIIIMDEIQADSITSFRQAMPIAPTVAVDQEGGTVQRYKESGELPSAEYVAANYFTDEAFDRYLADSKYLKSQGITANFAPVVDVSSRTPNPLPSRMYSEDPTTVVTYATANIKAAQQAGITPVIKHFPGLGSATANTDFATATTDPLSTLEGRDLIPYETLAPLHPDVMVGNMIVPELTNGQPAIWSPEAIGLLRGLGYQDAVIYSDSLTALAVPGTLEEAAVKAWVAGIDVALFVQSDTDTLQLSELFRAIIHRASEGVQSGELLNDSINESVLRILDRKQIDPCQLTIE